MTQYKTIGKFEEMVLYAGGCLQLNGQRYNFENKWNKDRHILGIMATVNPDTRIHERLN